MRCVGSEKLLCTWVLLSILGHALTVAAGDENLDGVASIQALIAECMPGAAADLGPAMCPQLTQLASEMSTTEAEQHAQLADNHFGAAMTLLGAARAPTCAAELHKEPTEHRCAQLMYKSAIQRLWMAGRDDLAELAWQEATEAVNGSQRILWPSVDQASSLWVPEYEVKDEVISCGSFPPVDLDIVRSEMEAMVFDQVFPYLFAQGSWEGVFLFRRNEWNETACSVLSQTCASLQKWFPVATADALMMRYQEVVLFRTKTGTKVSPHVGSLNGMVNMHWTVHGGDAAVLRVGKNEFPLQDGHGVCFLDSVRHEIHHSGEAHRWSLVIRTPHPELACHVHADSPYKGMSAETGVCKW
mmetsp:Transcript_35339/g.82571  ORF Transcript_35339/g.82571 Transcript_35339/m.82571 type:complete len:357 (-) Transcript_35339:26-1096(-)